MRFKLSVFILSISATYVLILGYLGDLDLYIHPRYIIFTIALSVAGLAVMLLNATHYESDEKHRFSFNLLPIILVLIFAVVLPARSLTSATISQRLVSDQSSAALNPTESTANLFSNSSRILGVGDWTQVLASNPDPKYYTNKKANISGFAYDAGLGDDTVWLARFVVTCCAVDARPIGVPVHIKNWEEKYEQDQWIEVTGGFKQAQTPKGLKIVIEPESVKKIQEPENPYAN